MSREGDFIKGILIGGLIGAAIGILYAPRSGRETREEIARKSDELLSKARDEYEKGLEKGRKAYEELQGKVTNWTETGKGTLMDSIEDGKGRIKRAVEAGIEAEEEKDKQKI